MHILGVNIYKTNYFSKVSDILNQLHPHTMYAVAHTALRSAYFNNHSRTLRLVLESNITATHLQVRFSNQYGKAPLPIGTANFSLCHESGTLLPGSITPITVQGKMDFELPASEDIVSDPVPFPISPGNLFALNIYYPTEEPVVSGNHLGDTVTRSKPGNYSAETELPGPSIMRRFFRTVVISDLAVAVTSVCEVIAHCPAKPMMVACFGDSIMQQCNWTVPFTRRLYQHYPGQISLCNLGIGGNRLLADSPSMMNGHFGKAGIHRFAHDILSLKGLTHAIVCIGTNDLGHPGSLGAPESDLPTLEEYVAAMESLAQQLHQKGVTAYVATLLPRALHKPYDEEREMLRQQMNHWIRTNTCYDAVLDFDAVVRRQDGQPGMQDDCVIYDGLHPSHFGGIQIAKSIDLTLFAPTTLQKAREAAEP